MTFMRIRRDGPADHLKSAVLSGLSSDRRSVPSTCFYDARGSRLFNEICGLPEYYQTRTELSILGRRACEVMREFRSADIIELGAGADLKIRTLLNAAAFRAHDLRYVPVDVSEEMLLASSSSLLASYPGLNITAVSSDFTTALPRFDAGRKKLFLFFGSTLGNFTEAETDRLLGGIASRMTGEDRLLLGLDMLKEGRLLRAAYNDSRGVTAEFNRNILRVLNARLRGDFDPALFDHRAFFDPELQRVEMHLQARRRMVVSLRDAATSFVVGKGESIRTEICRKFSLESVTAAAHRAGLQVVRCFSDPKRWFSLFELRSLSGV